MSVLDNLDNSSVLDDLNNSLNVIDDINSQQIYIASYSNETDVPVVTPVVPICFVSGSKVLTDNGLIEIQNINTNIHTIRNKKIIALTKTKLSQNYLVKVNKGSLYKNVPDMDTVMSPNHKIFYSGKMIEVKDIIGKMIGVSKISYNGEFLYNILLETHEKIIVNNLITETLSPNNIVSLIYRSCQNETEKNILFNELNEIIVKNDLDKFVKLSKKLSKK